MEKIIRIILGAVALLVLLPSAASAEILAMMNYETKPEQTIRREGIAIVDVDPKSKNFGKILADIPLPPNFHAHHIFYNKDAGKAYITALKTSALHVMDLKKFPYRIKPIKLSGCNIGEDVVFSDDNKRWYLTCMGSDNVIVGDAVKDRVIQTIAAPAPGKGQPVKTSAASGKAFIKYPHGIAVHGGIDRMIVTSTVRHTDLGDPGETVTVIKASNGRVLSTHKVSNKPSPSGEAPVEVLFIPKSSPPRAYITNMFGGTLWMAAWNPKKKKFGFSQVFDFAPTKTGVPLEMYFNKNGDRLYLTTAKPGYMHIFNTKNPAKPKLLKSIRAADGAHHVAFTKDGRYAFVQNSFLNLPGMSDGSVTVIDLKKEKKVASMDTLKNMGLNPNLIVLLPEWNDPAGH